MRNPLKATRAKDAVVFLLPSPPKAFNPKEWQEVKHVWITSIIFALGHIQVTTCPINTSPTPSFTVECSVQENYKSLSSDEVLWGEKRNSPIPVKCQKGTRKKRSHSAAEGTRASVQPVFSMSCNEPGTFVWIVLVAKHDRKAPWTCSSWLIWTGRSVTPLLCDLGGAPLWQWNIDKYIVDLIYLF